MLQTKTDLCRCVYYKAMYGSLAIDNHWLSMFHLWLVPRKAGHGGFIATPKGKWRFDAARKKIHLFHKNYRFRQSTSGNYHRQFIREWTVKELVAYIARHDGNG